MRDVMRGAWCVICTIVVGAALSACSDPTALSTAQAGSTPSVAVSQTPTPLSVQPTPKPMGTVCSGDAEPPTVASGWRLLWQKVFDHPIAQPPIVDGQQVILVARADPSPVTMKDTVLAIDPQAGSVQWQITDAQQPVPFEWRKVLAIKNSTKYVLLVFSYEKPQRRDTPNPVEYEIVVDRGSGQVVYDSGTLADVTVMALAISDETLWSRDAYGYLHRIDLPAGSTRWITPWQGESARAPRGLFVIEDWLYAFDFWGNVSQYDPADGALVRTALVGITPNPNDVFIQDKSAVVRSEKALARFDFRSLLPLWSRKISYLVGRRSNAFGYELPSMTLSSDSIYLFDARDSLLKLDLSTGQTLWSAASPGAEAMSRPAAAAGLVYGLFADGTLRAFSDADGKSLGVVMKVPLYYWKDTDPGEFLDLVGGLGVSGDTLIVTTGCRSVYAIQRVP